jgi:DNA-binding response OmpR family regulator
MDNIEYKNHMKALRKTYEANLPARVNHIRTFWDNCLKSGEFAEADLADMRFSIHKLAGSGTTFGFPVVSEVAERLELLLKIISENHEVPSQTQKDQIQSQLVTLSAMSFISEADDMEKVPNTDEMGAISAVLSDTGNRILYVVDDDIEFSKMLELELSKFGFKPYLFSSSAEFEQAYKKLKPDVILMDMALDEGVYAGAEVTRRINTGEDKLVPVVFISVSDSFESRLQAVRAGATHYFKKPFDIKLLAQTLEDVSKTNPVLPYRVLIIDDDEELTNVYRLTLETAGIVAAAVNDPLQALETLKSFNPDLILIDVLMPHCNGIELATIIRQYREYDLIPIVFLSTEWRKEIKLASLNLGSDDFMSKPISPWYLVEILKARIRRARILRAGTDKIKQF